MDIPLHFLFAHPHPQPEKCNILEVLGHFLLNQAFKLIFDATPPAYPFITLLRTPHMTILQENIYFLFFLYMYICLNMLLQYMHVGCSEQCNGWVHRCCGVKNWLWYLLEEKKPKNFCNFALFKMQNFGGFWTFSTKLSLEINFWHHSTNSPLHSAALNTPLPIL